MRKRYKVGAVYGHCGQGRGIHVYIPILAENILHAIKRAEKMGGLKKKFKHFWHVEEVDPLEFLLVRRKWRKFKRVMREKEWLAKRRNAG